MTERERLQQRLNEADAQVGGIMPGPNGTPENVAGEINRALDNIEAGDFEEVTPETGQQKTHVKSLLRG